MLSFTLNINPPTTTAQEHKVGIRNGKPYFYDPPELKDTKQKLMAFWNNINLRILLPFRFAYVRSGCIRLPVNTSPGRGEILNRIQITFRSCLKTV